jgi:excisionase family DNA binding protein
MARRMGHVVGPVSQFERLVLFEACVANWEAGLAFVPPTLRVRGWSGWFDELSTDLAAIRRPQIGRTDMSQSEGLGKGNGRYRADWLTVRDVARLLQVSPATVRRWLRYRRLRGVLVGGRAGYRIRRADLETFLRVASAQGPKLSEGISQT